MAWCKLPQYSCLLHTQKLSCQSGLVNTHPCICLLPKFIRYSNLDLYVLGSMLPWLYKHIQEHSHRKKFIITKYFAHKTNLFLLKQCQILTETCFGPNLGIIVLNKFRTVLCNNHCCELTPTCECCTPTQHTTKWWPCGSLPESVNLHHALISFTREIRRGGYLSTVDWSWPIGWDLHHLYSGARKPSCITNWSERFAKCPYQENNPRRQWPSSLQSHNCNSEHCIPIELSWWPWCS